MDPDDLVIGAHLLGAVLAGGMIGLERSFHGRPAGFRTHTLVCLASSLLMLLAFYPQKWMPPIVQEAVRTDPTRMAQGIMTGIGFLGAGVIFKEGLTIRGLTTAASIWITAAIGILIGVGLYFPAILATLLTLGILSLFRYIESRMPNESYAHHYIRFDRTDVLPEAQLRALLAKQGFGIANMSYRITQAGAFEYRMVIRSSSPENVSRLAEVLRDMPAVREFRIAPTGD
jgi:putative Mg2+ transporter-C (MgtC) family protein